MPEEMTQREHHIYELLMQADEFAYVPEDKSDLYTLSPPHFGPGLLRFPGEYSGMNETELSLHLRKMLSTGVFFFIPLSREWMNREH